jgi:hypothetical protein
MPTTIHGTNGITFNDGSTQNTRPAVGFRNRIINGDMRIWQRGTTISNPTSANFYTADRWGCNRAADVTGATVSRDISGLSGFEYSLKLQRTAGNTSTGALSLWYSNESTNTYDLAGSPVTLSFWAKTGANYSGGVLNVVVYSGTGTDERVYAYTGATAIVSTSQAITSTWTRYTLTGTVPANSTELGLQISWTPTGTAGADDSVYITGVQLEQGSTATEFERRPIGTELALCQRYYQKRVGDSYSTGVSGQAYGTATVYGSVSFIQEMRSSPNISLTATGSAANTISFMNNLLAHPATMGTITANTISVNGFQMLGNGYTSGFTAGNASLLYRNGLGEIWNASAEL